MNYKDIALFTDLDGTLFTSERTVSEENRRAIRRFIDGGGSFGISTGRAPANAGLMLPGMEMNTWSVVLNGAEGYHFVRRQSCGETSLPKKEIMALVDWVLKELPMVNVQLCTPDRLFFLSDPQFADEDFVTSHQPLEYAAPEAVAQEKWMKILFCAPRPILQQLLDYAGATGEAGVMDSVFTNEVYLEFLPRNTNKGTCLAGLRQQPELWGKTFVAIGDYTNDIELLQEADIAVAVANALPAVKKIADYVVCSNDEHALAYLIDVLIPSL